MSHINPAHDAENELSEDVESENEVCPDCNGTGEVDDFNYDNDSHEWINDGTKKCVCKLEN